MEARLRRERTTKVQYAKMIELVKLKPDIGQGLPLRPTDEIDAFWENLALECNKLGPPIRDAQGWKQAWCFWKVFVHKKLAKIVNKQTKRFTRFTYLEEQVLTMIKHLRYKVPDSALPPPRGSEHNNGDEEYLDDSDNEHEENMSIEFDPNNESSSFSSKHKDCPSNNIQKFQVQRADDPLSTQLHYNDHEEEEESDVKLMQQEQVAIQKNFCEESKEFQMNTNAALQDVSLTLELLRGSMKRIEDMSERSLKEEMHLNRKTEELLQKLVERDLANGNRKK